MGWVNNKGANNTTQFKYGGKVGEKKAKTKQEYVESDKYVKDTKKTTDYPNTGDLPEKKDIPATKPKKAEYRPILQPDSRRNKTNVQSPSYVLKIKKKTKADEAKKKSKE